VRPVDQLLAEHAAVRSVLRPLEVDLHAGHVTPDGARTAARTLAILIEPHARREQALVGRAPWVPAFTHLVQEHRQLDALLARASNGDVRALDELVHLLWGHFEEEERDAFPILRSVGL
jgi:hypothetical protein